MIKMVKFTDGNEMQAGTLFCVASNYAKHADEMGTKVPSLPAIFLKPPQSIISEGEEIILPEISSNVHHEVELVVVIGSECKNINREDAVDCVAGYAVGIDVTMRDIQAQAKKDGKPWAVAKGFYTSAPLSDVLPSSNFGNDIPDFELVLSVNGQERQRERTSAMERDIPMLIEYLSTIFTLMPGDMIFTGTPKGVGQIQKGDRIHAELSDFISLDVRVK